MWPFKNPIQRLRQVVTDQYGDYLRSRGFEPEAEVPGRPIHLWGIIFRSKDFRLRLSQERGQSELFLDAAPLLPSGKWYEQDWYSVYHVAKRLVPGVSLHPQWTCGPDAVALAAHHDLLAHFFSGQGEEARENFVRETTGRTPWPAEKRAPS
jgi:hypothetical protein